MHDSDRNELRRRIIEQGWTQGASLPARHDLFLADLRAPITAEAQAVRNAEGEAALAVVHHVESEDPGMVVVSQRCDLVANLDVEPMCEAIPLIGWPDEQALPAPSSSRFFLIERDRRIVACHTRRLLFEKTMLPDRDAEQMLQDEGAQRRFRAWCGRRLTRIPLPDDFNATIGRAVRYVLAKSGRSEAPELQATFPWRVLREPAEDGAIEVSVIVPYNEQHGAADGVDGFVEGVMEAVAQRLPNEHARAEKWAASRDDVKIRTHRITRHVCVRADQLTLRDILDSEPMDLEYLTYEGQAVVGELPVEDQLA